MVGHILGSNPKERRLLETMHGVGSSDKPARQPVPIAVPKQGSRPREASSSHPPRNYSRKSSSGYRRSTFPSHPTQFSDDLYNDISTSHWADSPSSSRRTVSGSDSTMRRRSSGSQSQAQPLSPEKDISVVISNDTRNSGKGKGKARETDLSPSRPTRKSRHKAHQSNIISFLSSEDEDDIQHVPSPPPTEPTESLALRVKANRRQKDAATTSAAHPDQFYARSGRPVRIEQPDERRASRSQAPAVVELASGSESENEWQPTPVKMIDRMKPRNPSPNGLTRSQQTSPIASGSNSASSLARSPKAQSTRKHSSSYHSIEIKRDSPPSKRKRTDSTQPSQGCARAFSLPHEVALDAIVVSDVWRSREDAKPLALFQSHHLAFALTVHNMLKIQYNDMQQVVMSKPEVQKYGTISFTLRPDSESARRVQDLFTDYDPRASGGAGEIQLIARTDEADLERHRWAVKFLEKTLLKSASEDGKMEWLDQAAAKSKIGCVAGVKQLPWPQPAKQRSTRTLIIPGSGRAPPDNARDRERTSSSFAPQQPRKKVFDIQPASPKLAARAADNVEMPDRSPSSKSPVLPALTLPKGKPANPAPAPKVDSRHQALAASSEQILQYPYEGVGAVGMYGRDFERLLDGQLLNDIVIEFGLKYMLEQIRNRSPDLATSIHVFNTFFWKVLMDDPLVENSYRKLRRWTSKVDLFSKKYIVVPINEDYHWYLALIVNPGLMLVDAVKHEDKDSGSEQDRDEVASSLTVARKTTTPPPAASAADDQAQQADAAGASAREQAQPVADSEPETPPLPPSFLPLRSAGVDRPSSAFSSDAPMDVDKDSRASTPTKSAHEPLNLNQTYIITFDSLGSRHQKVGNKLHEYLWREALDKNRLTPSQLAEMVAREERKQAAQQSSETRQTRAQDAAQKQSTENAKDAPMDESADGLTGDARADRTTERSTAADGSLRLVPVRDSRQAAESTSSKPPDVEALAKRLPKTPYIDALVPTQPNFCDCGIYLLHYFDRFFCEPEKLLGLIVEGKRRIVSVNKEGPSKRMQCRAEVARSVESEWQAGEVSTKRQYWRQTILDLSSGWKAHNRAKKAAEALAKREKSEESNTGAEKPATENGAQQEQSGGEHSGNVSPPDADPTDSAATMPAQAQTEGGGQAQNGSSADSGSGSASCDIERSVNELVQGKDVNGQQFVDSVIKAAWSKQNGQLSQEPTAEGVQSGNSEQRHRKTPSEWMRMLQDDDSPATLPLRTDDIAISTPPMPSIASPLSPAPVAASKHKFGETATPTLASTSSASLPQHRQQSKQHEQQPERLPSFGSFMLDQSGSSFDLQPPLSFNSSNDLKRPREKPDEASSDESNSSASVAEMVGSTPSPSSSGAADAL